MTWIIYLAHFLVRRISTVDGDIFGLTVSYATARVRRSRLSEEYLEDGYSTQDAQGTNRIDF